MKRNQGFTLIELIIVIVILGILAVTAAPKFLNFSGDAKASVVKGIEGSVKASLALVNGKAQLAGTANSAVSCFDPATNTVTAGTTCASPLVGLVYGSPSADEASLKAVAELSDFKFTVDTGVVYIGADSVDTSTTPASPACYALYTPATSTAAATVEAVTTGCK